MEASLDLGVFTPTWSKVLPQQTMRKFLKLLSKSSILFVTCSWKQRPG
jgi:hypothetical protein